MRDEEYPAEQIPGYGSEAQPAIVARMTPHLRMTQAGTVAAGVAFLAGVAAVVTYPDFTGPDYLGGRSGRVWTAAAAVSALVMLLICGYQLWGWRQAMAVWRGEQHRDLRSLARISWAAHLASYGVVLIALWASIAGSAAASWSATSSILLVVSLASMVAAQVLAAVQYVRDSGPPGTIPAHMRRLIERERATADRERRAVEAAEAARAAQPRTETEPAQPPRQDRPPDSAADR